MTPWKKTFVSAFIAQVISILGFAFAYPFLPYFIAELGVVDEARQAFLAGMVMGSEGFAMAFFAPLWGIFSDRKGRKLVVCISMFGGTIVVFLMSFVQTVGQLIVCRLLEGAIAGTMAASLALVASVTPLSRKGFALGMIQSAVLIGASIGPLLGGISADAFGYRVTFRLGALLILIGGIVAYLGIFEKFSPPQTKKDGDEKREAGFGQLLILKGFLPAALIIFGVKFSNTLINPSFPLIIRNILPTLENLNSITGSIMAMAGLAGAFSAAFFGFTGDKLGYRRILIICCFGSAFASLGHFFSYSLNHFILARIFFGLMVAGMMPAANAIIYSIIDKHSIGRAYGLANSISMIGLALGPLIGGYTAKVAGLRMPFLLAAATQFFFALMVMFFIKPGKSRYRHFCQANCSNKRNLRRWK